MGLCEPDTLCRWNYTQKSLTEGNVLLWFFTKMTTCFVEYCGGGDREF